MEQSRTCTKCQTAKPLSQFPKEKRCKEGRRHQCTQCRNTTYLSKMTEEERLAKTAIYRRSPSGKDAKARGQKKWRQSDKGKAHSQRPDVRDYRNEKMRRYRSRNPEKNAARQAIRVAKRRGLIPAASGLPCAYCGGKSREYHHHLGYAPKHHLDVIPLCKPCHYKAG